MLAAKGKFRHRETIAAAPALEESADRNVVKGNAGNLLLESVVERHNVWNLKGLRVLSVVGGEIGLSLLLQHRRGEPLQLRMQFLKRKRHLSECAEKPSLQQQRWCQLRRKSNGKM
jgi:hypothetical protein